LAGVTLSQRGITLAPQLGQLRFVFLEHRGEKSVLLLGEIALLPLRLLPLAFNLFLVVVQTLAQSRTLFFFDSQEVVQLSELCAPAINVALATALQRVFEGSDRAAQTGVPTGARLEHGMHPGQQTSCFGRFPAPLFTCRCSH
jgi:hypothetical protein